MRSLLLFFCCIFSVTNVNSQIASMFKNDFSGFCCNNKSSAKVRPVPTSLAEIVEDSPIYEQMVTDSFYTQMLDNVCDTFYKFDNKTYLRLTSLTYADGSLVIQKFIVSELPGYVGVFRVQGLAQKSGSSSICYDEVCLGTVCPGVKVYYRNIIAGRCDILSYATMGNIDYLYSESSSRETSDYCNSQIAAVAKRQNLRVTRYSELPKKLNRNCVTKLNGVSCINADRVLPQDSYTLPDTRPACQTDNTYYYL